MVSPLAVGPAEVSTCILIEACVKPAVIEDPSVNATLLSRQLAVFLLKELKVHGGANLTSLVSIVLKLQQDLGHGGVVLARHVAQRLERLQAPDDINHLYLVRTIVFRSSDDSLLPRSMNKFYL